MVLIKKCNVVQVLQRYCKGRFLMKFFFLFWLFNRFWSNFLFLTVWFLVFLQFLLYFFHFSGPFTVRQGLPSDPRDFHGRPNLLPWHKPLPVDTPEKCPKIEAKDSVWVGNYFQNGKHFNLIWIHVSKMETISILYRSSFQLIWKLSLDQYPNQMETVSISESSFQISWKLLSIMDASCI